ncbi:TIGR03643 family protein [Motilimonas cestriensis]|uniref:TIGR03643 family protein n=1 Tax=Motilimonas cestriensis TaxID=2742685 RepID=A0ABS8WBA2_9GAMM|nr:TIGR03643 family protein [Motilimonas cestriensis]MCE2594866.1 TIGR03643 family protein [Motilimonas cestriensis]
MNNVDISRIIEMAWEDRTPFEAIHGLYGLTEPETIKLMRQQLTSRSFKNWRQRVSGRKTKHLALRSDEIDRGYCPTQYKHSRGK